MIKRILRYNVSAHRVASQIYLLQAEGVDEVGQVIDHCLVRVDDVGRLISQSIADEINPNASPVLADSADVVAPGELARSAWPAAVHHHYRLAVSPFNVMRAILSCPHKS